VLPLPTVPHSEAHQISNGKQEELPEKNRDWQEGQAANRIAISS